MIDPADVTVARISSCSLIGLQTINAADQLHRLRAGGGRQARATEVLRPYIANIQGDLGTLVPRLKFHNHHGAIAF